MPVCNDKLTVTLLLVNKKYAKLIVIIWHMFKITYPSKQIWQPNTVALALRLLSALDTNIYAVPLYEIEAQVLMHDNSHSDQPSCSRHEISIE